MALLNDLVVSFYGLSFSEIGEMILEASPSGDGKGIILELSQDEENAFVGVGGFQVGNCIVGLITYAVEKKTGVLPVGLQYTYTSENHRFTT